MRAKGRASPRWPNLDGADAFLVLRDGEVIAGPLRIEGASKEWTDAR